MATISKCSVQVRLDESLKKEAETVFDNLGLDTPTAIRIFFKKVVATRSIPFALDENPYVFSAEEEAEILAAAKESYEPDSTVAVTSCWEETKQYLDSLKK